MKNSKNFSKLFTFITAMFLMVSCQDDGGDSNRNLQESGTPNIVKITTTETTLNLNSIQNDVPINIGLKFDIGYGNVTAMDVVGIYTKGTVTEKAVLKSKISGFPVNVNITQADLIAAFTILNSKNDFTATDKLKVTADLYLADGTKVELFRANGASNFGTDISNTPSFKLFQDYVVFCPLTNASSFNGTFKVVKDDWQDYAIGATVPVVFDSGYKFRIMNTNNPYLVNTNSYYEVTVNPANGSVTVKSNVTLDYGGGFTTNVTGTGSVGTCTGEVNLKLNFSGSSQNQTFNLVKN